MANVIELNPVDFVTVGTIGPKGLRTFHLQAGQDSRIVSFTIEKEQAQALSSAIAELLDDIDERDNSKTEADFSNLDMELREPIEPLFRIAQMGLAYEAHENKVILIAQEYVPQSEEELQDEDLDDDGDDEGGRLQHIRRRSRRSASRAHVVQPRTNARPQPARQGYREIGTARCQAERAHHLLLDLIVFALSGTRRRNTKLGRESVTP